MKRDLYIIKDGIQILADVNGMMTILRKIALPNAFAEKIVARGKAPLVVYCEATYPHRNATVSMGENSLMIISKICVCSKTMS